MAYLASRTHEIAVGHRVYGHEGKCKHLHGHNYRFVFNVTADELDDLNRVIDFSVIKSKLCQWLEENWDHRTILWEFDPIGHVLMTLSDEDVREGIFVVPFNPTAEAIAEYLVNVIGPIQLRGTGCVLHSVEVHETGKCYATYVREG